jgi:AraC-like DNA-binding protein
MESLALDKWFAALLSPQSEFSLSLLHLSGRLRMPPQWLIEGVRLPNHLFYFVAEGGFFAEWDGQIHHIAAGDLLWVGQNSPLSFHLDQGENLVVWRFRLDASDADGVALTAPRPFWHVSAARSCEIWIENLLEETAHPTTRSDVRLRGLLLCLFTELERSAIEASFSGLLTSTQQQILRSHLAQCVGKWPSPADLARRVELSPDYFTRCFRRTYGLAPRRFLLEERMRQATVRLLESSASVSQIARDLGYEDIFTFSRQFKAVQGVSPSQYRRQHGAIAAL